MLVMHVWGHVCRGCVMALSEQARQSERWSEGPCSQSESWLSVDFYLHSYGRLITQPSATKMIKICWQKKSLRGNGLTFNHQDHDIHESPLVYHMMPDLFPDRLTIFSFDTQADLILRGLHVDCSWDTLLKVFNFGKAKLCLRVLVQDDGFHTFTR